MLQRHSNQILIPILSRPRTFGMGIAFGVQPGSRVSNFLGQFLDQLNIIPICVAEAQHLHWHSHWS